MPITPQAYNALITRAKPHTEARSTALFTGEGNTVSYIGGLAPEILSSALTDLSALDGVNPALTVTDAKIRLRFYPCARSLIC